MRKFQNTQPKQPTQPNRPNRCKGKNKSIIGNRHIVDRVSNSFTSKDNIEICPECEGHGIIGLCKFPIHRKNCMFYNLEQVNQILDEKKTMGQCIYCKAWAYTNGRQYVFGHSCTCIFHIQVPIIIGDIDNLYQIHHEVKKSRCAECMGPSNDIGFPVHVVGCFFNQYKQVLTFTSKGFVTIYGYCRSCYAQFRISNGEYIVDHTDLCDYSSIKKPEIIPIFSSFDELFAYYKKYCIYIMGGLYSLDIYCKSLKILIGESLNLPVEKKCIPSIVYDYALEQDNPLTTFSEDSKCIICNECLDDKSFEGKTYNKINPKLPNRDFLYMVLPMTLNNNTIRQAHLICLCKTGIDSYNVHSISQFGVNFRKSLEFSRQMFL